MSTRLVYSTEHGRVCPDCRHSMATCICKRNQAVVGDGKVRVSLDTKGRKGKGVTVVKGLPLAPDALEALGRQLKAACGSGGTVKDGCIEVQGDHVEKVLAWLAARPEGWKPKRAGG